MCELCFCCNLKSSATDRQTSRTCKFFFRYFRLVLNKYYFARDDRKRRADVDGKRWMGIFQQCETKQPERNGADKSRRTTKPPPPNKKVYILAEITFFYLAVHSNNKLWSVEVHKWKAHKQLLIDVIRFPPKKAESLPPGIFSISKRDHVQYSNSKSIGYKSWKVSI